MVDYTRAVYPEAYVWVVLAWASIVARYVSRRLLVRRWNFQPDDWVMILVAVFYISTIVFNQLAEVYNLMVNNLDPLPDNIKELDFWTYLFAIFADHTTIATVWLCKACLLIMLYRMTINLKQNVVIRVIAVITALSWVFLLVGFLTWCYPLEEYVLFKVTNEQCELPTNFHISVAVCNIATDVFIILVTVPMFWRSRIPTKKKIPIIILFSLGLITVAITAAGRILPLVDPESSNALILLWNTREASASIIITNLPLTMPFFTRLRKSTSKWTSSGPLTWLRSQSSARDTGYSKSGMSKAETHDNNSLASAGQSIYKDVEFSTTYSEKHDFSDISYPQTQPVDFTSPVPKAYAV